MHKEELLHVHQERDSAKKQNEIITSAATHLDLVLTTLRGATKKKKRDSTYRYNLKINTKKPMDQRETDSQNYTIILSLYKVKDTGKG